MAKLFYGHVSVDGVKIHYYRTSEEKPPLVLLHGLTDNGLCWERLALKLENLYDLVLIDARGHGLSDAPESGYHPEDHAADVAAVISELGLQTPALIGHSMGAMTAIVAAANYPHLIGGVLLEDPPLLDQAWLEEEAAARSAEWRDRILSLRQKPLDELIELGRSKNPAWQENELFQWAKAKQQARPGAALTVSAAHTSWRQVIQNVACPALLITGDVQSGAIITPAVAQEAAGLMKNCSLAYIAGAGHSIRREQYHAYEEAVMSFLRKNRAQIWG